MGKQKSFIIVGSTFIAFILILLLMPLITSGLKTTKIKFESTSINVPLGRTRGIAPVIYAGGNIGEDIVLEYTILSGQDIIDITPGTYSKGFSTKHTWAFYELDFEGKEITKETNIPYDPEDKITIRDGFWYVGEENTGCEAEDNYSEEEIMQHAVSSEEATSFTCFILNGQQTDIVYDSSIKPVQNTETKTWFINGKDTGYSYEGIQATIASKDLGTAVIECKGVVEGKEISATLRINVVEDDPISCNPSSVSNPYLESTLVLQEGAEFELEYTVNGKNPDDPEDKPLQDIEIKVKNDIVNIRGTLVEVEVEGVKVEKMVYTVKVNHLGEEETMKVGTIDLIVPKDSYKVGQEKNLKNTITIIVLGIDQEKIDKINEAREAVTNIGTVQNTPESREAVALARQKVNEISEYLGVTIAYGDPNTADDKVEEKYYIADAAQAEKLQSVITNYSKLTNAETRIKFYDSQSK